MTTLTASFCKWIAATGAFLAVLAAAGCSSQEPASPVSDRSAPSLPVSVSSPVFYGADGTPVHSANQITRQGMDARAPKAPAINLYGEVDGVTYAPAPSVGQVSLQQHTFLDEGYDSDITVDPTGTWMAYASTRNSEHAGIYLQRVGGSSVTQLTSSNADDAYPAFSPDGKHVAFCSSRAGNWDLYVMDTDGRNVVQVTSGPTQDVHPSFSPDGTHLVYSSLGSHSNQWELWTVALQTGERKMIAYGLFPSWSPSKEGNRIAFQRARARGSRCFSLWTLDLLDGEARRLTEIAASPNAAIVSPTWSPDGKHLAFTTIVEPTLGAGGKSLGKQDIWMIDTDGANRRRLTDGNGTNLAPSWAVDNRVYFISDRSGNESVWSVQVNPASMQETFAAEPKTPAKSDPAGAVGAVDTHEVEH